MSENLDNLDHKQLGRQILMYRKDRGITQGDLASRAGISRTYVSIIETGKARNISVKVLYALAAELGVTPADLGLTLTDRIADLETRLATLENRLKGKNGMNTLEGFATEQLAMDLRAAFVQQNEAAALVSFYATLQTLLNDSVRIRYELLNNTRQNLDGWKITVSIPGHDVSVSGPLAAPYLAKFDYAQDMASNLAHALGERVFLREGQGRK